MRSRESIAPGETEELRQEEQRIECGYQVLGAQPPTPLVEVYDPNLLTVGLMFDIA